MAFTISGDVLNGLYEIRILQTDVLAESIRKSFEIANIAAGSVQNAMRAYEGISQASIDTANVSIGTTVTGASATVTSLGLFPKIGDQMVLGFDRPHPIVTNRSLVTRSFVVLTPHPDVINLTTLKPEMVRGELFPGATRTEALGSLVDFLEDALTYVHDGVTYVGGFTYREARSGLIGAGRQYDADSLT